VRYYQMSYIPPGFWPRLTARLLIFPKRALQVFDQQVCACVRVYVIDYNCCCCRAFSTVILRQSAGVVESTVCGQSRPTS